MLSLLNLALSSIKFDAIGLSFVINYFNYNSFLPRFERKQDNKEG